MPPIPSVLRIWNRQALPRIYPEALRRPPVLRRRTGMSSLLHRNRSPRCPIQVPASPDSGKCGTGWRTCHQKNMMRTSVPRDMPELSSRLWYFCLCRYFSYYVPWSAVSRNLFLLFSVIPNIRQFESEAFLPVFYLEQQAQDECQYTE